ncbi:PHM/PNGase F domain-containing protein [Chytriomyces sp. MP71]|nr:PHM/PNGase F domain-containing protein [Chytriomyces sp. MP71]
MLQTLLAVVVLPLAVRSATCVGGNFKPGSFQQCTQVASNLAVHWIVDATAGDITFGVDMDLPASASNWVGIGISDNGGMFGTDTWILLQNSTGGYYIQDGFAMQPGIPVPDASQDVFLVNPPTPSANSTVYTFKRKLKTCDANDYDIVVDTLFHMVWAHGTAVNGAPNQHANGPADRGNFVALLYNSTVASVPTTSGLSSFEVVMPSAKIPTTVTNYICTTFSVPVTTKNQIFAFEAILNDSTKQFVHHMVVYRCSQSFANAGAKFACTGMPNQCSVFAMVWAPGSGLTQYPASAGYPLPPNQYFALQIHYTNPQGISGVVDSSGLRLYYSAQLREHDVGVLTVGTTEISVPGNFNGLTGTGDSLCSADCTAQFPSNLTVLGNFFHMHSLGYNMSSRLVRGGKEIVPLGVRKYYSYDFQGLTPALPGTVIMPGDQIVTQCTYGPTDASHGNLRPYYTLFGPATTDEMCFNFIAYYPAMTNVDYCMTSSQAPGRVLCQAEQNGKTYPISSNTAFSPQALPVCPNAYFVALPAKTGSSSGVGLKVPLFVFALLGLYFF